MMKPATRKMMRVATTFTGAAACAVAFNPAARADTGQPAAQLALAGDRTIEGSIHETNDCGYSPNNHFFRIMDTAHTTSCFGWYGLLILSPWPNLSKYCGGNNTGVFWGSGPNGGNAYGFGPGSTWAYRRAGSAWFYVSELGISGWNGTKYCKD